MTIITRLLLGPLYLPSITPAGGMLGCLAPVVIILVPSFVIVEGLRLFDVPVQGLTRPVESWKPPAPRFGPAGRLPSMRFAQDAKPVNSAAAEKEFIPFLHAESNRVVLVLAFSLPFLLLFFAVNAIVSPRFGKPAQDTGVDLLAGVNLLGLVAGLAAGLLVAIVMTEISTGMWPRGGIWFRIMAHIVVVTPSVRVGLHIGSKVSRLTRIEGSNMIRSSRRRHSKGRNNSTTPE